MWLLNVGVIHISYLMTSLPVACCAVRVREQALARPILLGLSAEGCLQQPGGSKAAFAHTSVMVVPAVPTDSGASVCMTCHEGVGKLLPCLHNDHTGQDCKHACTLEVHNPCASKRCLQVRAARVHGPIKGMGHGSALNSITCQAKRPTQKIQSREVQELVGGQVSSASVADVVLRLVGADENYSAYLSPSHTGWLADTGLMDALVTQVLSSLCTGCFHNKGTSEAQGPQGRKNGGLCQHSAGRGDLTSTSAIHSLIHPQP